MSQTAVELVEQVKTGSEEALIALHTQYAPLVYSVAYRVLNDGMAAEEVTQDTFMRLWHKADAYDPAKGSFVPWLLAITRRLAIDVFRKRRRDPMMDSLLIGEDIEIWENRLDTDESGDLRRMLAAVVTQLPGEQRQAIELAYFHGMTHSQIADYLNQPLGTIKTRIRLGMQKLREEWLTDPAANPNDNH